MKVVNITDARTRLSKWVDRAVGGEDIIVTRRGKPLIRITCLDESRRPIRFGLLEGQVRIAADFDAPLPEELLARIESR
jgi:prevent-host-death family protein